MSFFVAEVLVQAFVQANSPARRYERVYSEARAVAAGDSDPADRHALAERKLFARRSGPPSG